MEQKEFQSLLDETLPKLVNACSDTRRAVIVLYDNGEGSDGIALSGARVNLLTLLTSLLTRDKDFRELLFGSFKILDKLAQELKDEQSSPNPQQQANGDQGEEKD